LGTLAYSSLAADVPTVLVIPAKPSVVAFCTDVAMMRNVDVVSYEMTKKTTNAPSVLVLNLWNGKGADWTKIGLEEYKAGSIFKEMPKRVIFVGDNQEVKTASSAMGDLSAIPNLDTMGLANGLNDIFKFTSSQWKYLSKHYELKLKDLNWERRRYGKYGPPGSKLSAPMPQEAKSLELPPVEPEPAKVAPENK
jgi:hypothetical protein